MSEKLSVILDYIKDMGESPLDVGLILLDIECMNVFLGWLSTYWKDQYDVNLNNFSPIILERKKTEETRLVNREFSCAANNAIKFGNIVLTDRKKYSFTEKGKSLIRLMRGEKVVLSKSVWGKYNPLMSGYDSYSQGVRDSNDEIMKKDQDIYLTREQIDKMSGSGKHPYSSREIRAEKNCFSCQKCIDKECDFSKWKHTCYEKINERNKFFPGCTQHSDFEHHNNEIGSIK